MSKNYKLAIIGEESSVLLFRSLGVDVYAVRDQSGAVKELSALALEYDEDIGAEYAVVFVEESFYKEFPEDLLERLTRRPLPAVVPVPSPGADDNNFATNRLRKIVERAVGSDILG